MDRIARFVILLTLIVFCGGQTEAGWQVKQKQTSGNGTPWVLSQDGAITKVEPQKGDPKTSYSQSENCGHGSSDPCGGALNLAEWKITAQGGSNQTDNFSVSFLSGNPNYTTGFEVVQVYYNLKEGGIVTKAVKTTSYQTTEQPKVDKLIQQGGFTAYHSWRNGDGSYATQYRNAEGSHITAHYTASGDLKAALVDEREQLTAGQVNVQSYYDLPIPSCYSVSCEGFHKEVTITYDGRLLR